MVAAAYTATIPAMPKIKNTTIAHNEVAEWSGGGVCCEEDSIPSFYNCILWGNGNQVSAYEYGSQPFNFTNIRQTETGDIELTWHSTGAARAT